MLEQKLKEKDNGNSSRRKDSFDKSGWSNNHLSSDFDISIDENYDLYEKLPHAFEKLQLKKRSYVVMMQKIT